MRKVVIISAVRTAVGKHKGQWTNVPPEKLAAAAIKEAVLRAKIDPAEIEDVVMGNIQGQHGNLARIAAMTAGLPLSVGATTVDRQCGSGSQAVINAAVNIMAGYGDIYIACGVEHMTTAPYQLEKTAAYSSKPPAFLPNRLSIDELGNPDMPTTADTLGAMHNISRQECDEFALLSHSRAARAIKEGVFKDQIAPIEVKTKKGVQVIDTDECVRYDSSLETMLKLAPLHKGGLTTAGNSCPRSDGAGALVMMSEEKAKSLGLTPLASFRSFAVAGLDPNIMGYGPVPATRKVLQRAGLTIKDLDIIELNEAFAAQALPCIKDLGLDIQKTNPNGGAIALGHPIGGTGPILTTKLVHEMVKKNYKLGLVTMCIGGGQGLATIFERY
ncbi:thiolase family protein [Sporomusa sp.]|uniref:thiolase family protein n=1 Tax=Sporomusa sp. TaxID=2078658 RepID=UPI002B58A5D0|nr:thiolase family protein [Sporomusa sp.]HWR06972.1 thiolase family protein [Sporomusa sp.]